MFSWLWNRKNRNRSYLSFEEALQNERRSSLLEYRIFMRKFKIRKDTKVKEMLRNYVDGTVKEDELQDFLLSRADPEVLALLRPKVPKE